MTNKLHETSRKNSSHGYRQKCRPGFTHLQSSVKLLQVLLEKDIMRHENNSSRSFFFVIYITSLTLVKKKFKLLNKISYRFKYADFFFRLDKNYTCQTRLSHELLVNHRIDFRCFQNYQVILLLTCQTLR